MALLSSLGTLRPASIRLRHVHGLAFGLIAACGSEPLDQLDVSEALDAVAASDDVQTHDTLLPDVQNTTDTLDRDAEANDTGMGDTDREPGLDALSDIDIAPEETDATSDELDVVHEPEWIRGYIECMSDADCPSETPVCLARIPLNRPLSDGTGYVTVVDVFPGMEKDGVCAVSCSLSADTCAEISEDDAGQPFTCQLVWAGPSPYPDGDDRPPFPFDERLEPEQMDAGRPYAAMCRPPVDQSPLYASDFCTDCSSDISCLPGSACVAERLSERDEPSHGTCRMPCVEDSDCPYGFSCDALQGGTDIVLSGVDSGLFCRPVLNTCAHCLDRDGDGYGVGGCGLNGSASAVDCDDSDAAANYQGMNSVHAFPESCSPERDANCNGLSDDTEQIGTRQFGSFHCSTCGDTCEGSAPNALESACFTNDLGAPGTCVAICDNPGQFADCNRDRTDGCEVSLLDGSRLFLPDCDGDGVGSAAYAPILDCASEGLNEYPVAGGLCPAVTALPDGASGFMADCDDTSDRVSPQITEICDGIDNDCDGRVDPAEPFAPGTPCVPTRAVGACRDNAVLACDPSGGVVCEAAAPTEEVCDGIDNNCNYWTDDILVSTPVNRIGESCRHSSAEGVCGEGRLNCRGGSLVCVPVTPPTSDLPGDGMDADCDGFDGDLDRAIFVQSGGSLGTESTVGLRTNPAGSLERAWQVYFATRGARNQFYLAEGTYVQPYMIDPDDGGSGFSMIGGYRVAGIGDTVEWRVGSGISEIEFSGICSCSRWGNTCRPSLCLPEQAAISVVNPVGVRFQQLAFHVPIPTTGRFHVIGLHCRGTTSTPCAGLTLDRVDLSLEGGIPGLPAGFAPTAAAGANGVTGGVPVGPTPAPPGRGAVSTCDADGGGGGAGVSTAAVTEFCTDGETSWPVTPGDYGWPGYLPFGFSGQAGMPGRPVSDACADGSVNNDGGPGTTVTSGPGPAGGTGGRSITPMTATAGTTGQPGTAGGGGGGGGGSGSWHLWSSTGVGGAGGASGGCPGFAAAGGGPGWSVFGMWIEDTRMPTTVDFSLTVGPGGAGAPGQHGAPGGLGGPASRFPLGYGGAGGPGGHASGGGGGGGGGGGWSVGIALRRGAEVEVNFVPVVGAAGAAGRGGDGGQGGSGDITPFGGIPVPTTAVSGQRGQDGAPGEAFTYCSTTTTAVLFPPCR